ncbi:MAG: LysM peptidoglycan-binding domain-containing protein [Actinomycetota bacterium]
MNDGVTEPFEPYQPDGSDYDWDYEPEPQRSGPKVLWGRVALLAIFLILAFIIGRVTAGGGGGISQTAYNRLKQENATLKQQITTLQDQAAAAQPSAQATPSAQASASAAPPAGSQTYTVKANDTLRGIAQKFYGDSSLDDLIAQANGITDPSSLRIGQKLTIPPKP